MNVFRNSLVYGALSNHLIAHWLGFFNARCECMQLVELIEVYDEPLFARCA